MARHGWSEHGTPCCALAPLAQRPDSVTACGGEFKCPECQSAQVVAHFTFVDERILRDADDLWRIRAEVRLAYSVVNPSAFHIMTAGPH